MAETSVCTKPVRSCPGGRASSQARAVSGATDTHFLERPAHNRAAPVVCAQLSRKGERGSWIEMRPTLAENPRHLIALDRRQQAHLAGRGFEVGRIEMIDGRVQAAQAIPFI